MERCIGCLGIIFGARARKSRLKYRINYDSSGKNAGVEFDNLVLDDDDHQMNYGTTCHFVSQEEKEIIAKREYDRILEQQKKIDEQINKKTFEDEERLRIEEDRFREAQLEASRAVSAALKVTQYTKSRNESRNLPDQNLYSIDDSDESDDDDFEAFLRSVKVRSEAFRNDKVGDLNDSQSTNNNKVVSTQPKKQQPSVTSTDFTGRSREIDGIADGMSSDESFSFDQQLPGTETGNTEMEWDKFVDGLESTGKEKQESESVLENEDTEDEVDLT